MRNLIVFLLCLTVVVGCTSKNKNGTEETTADLLDTTYTVIGYADGVPQNSKFVLTRLGIDAKPDTAIVKDGKFVFKGVASEPLVGEIYALNTNNQHGAPIKLMIENATINIEVQKDSIQGSKVIGGLENTDFKDLKKMLTLYWDSIDAVALRQRLAVEAKDTMQSQRLRLQYGQMEKETRSAIKQYAIEHPKSISSAYYVLQYYTMDMDVNQLDSVYNSYDTSIRKSLYVRKIKAVLDAAKRTGIGQIAPELSVNNAEFDTINLVGLRGKYILINFWASWSAPSRQENLDILKAYNQYKSRGFEIIGVSLDTNKQTWLNAIKKDKLSWKNVSDLKGWQSSVVPLYGINEIPANFLLDKNGKIIAVNLRGDALEKKLGESLDRD